MSEQQSMRIDIILCDDCAEEIQASRVGHKFNITITDDQEECEHCGRASDYEQSYEDTYEG